MGGALLGNQFGKGSGKVAMTVVGGLAGAFLGHEIGANLDAADQAAAAKASEKALSENHPSTWANPENGHKGDIQPGRTFINAEGQTCREYQTTVYIDGKKDTAIRRACEGADKRWRDIEA